MIAKIEEMNKQLQDMADELRYRALKEENNIKFPDVFNVWEYDKPIHIHANNSHKIECQIEDLGEYYKILYPMWDTNPKTYLNDFCWYADKDSIFLIERPYSGRVVKILRELLPEHEVSTVKNDVMIDGCKIGPTQMAAQIYDWEGNQPSGSLFYLLRWAHVEVLDEIFANDPNHQLRQTKAPLVSLNNFFPNTTREEFINILEEKGRQL